VVIFFGKECAEGGVCTVSDFLSIENAILHTISITVLVLSWRKATYFKSLASLMAISSAAFSAETTEKISIKTS